MPREFDFTLYKPVTGNLFPLINYFLFFAASKLSYANHYPAAWVLRV